MQSGNDFVVYLDNGRFFRDVDGSTITATAAPSDAAYLTYDEATALVARFRRRGFPNAMVTNLAGEPMTADLLEEYRGSSAPSRSTSDNLPRTLKELNAIPVAEHRRRYRSEPAFRQRADELEVAR